MRLVSMLILFLEAFPAFPIEASLSQPSAKFQLYINSFCMPLFPTLLIARLLVSSVLTGTSACLLLHDVIIPFDALLNVSCA